MSTVLKPSWGYMIFAAIVAAILGVIMLLYPGGLMTLLAATFWAFQLFLSVFILLYTIMEAVKYFKAGSTGSGVVYLIIGALATVLVWLFDVGILYLIVALFFIISGIGEAVVGFKMFYGRYFMIFLGLVNVLLGVVMLRHPVILPLLIAWYAIFWGISRLFLALELRKLTTL